MNKTEGRYAQHVFRVETVVDGKKVMVPETAIRGFACWKCGKQEAEILACVEGDECKRKRD